ncbi:hypothetical protein [Nocardia sp. CA-120079]|uniref:hypothetical protein n=1 Tax=Nocardia sp. CA-120079 TaxID=3239974 RepID=UPI003D99168D
MLQRFGLHALHVTVPIHGSDIATHPVQLHADVLGVLRGETQRGLRGALGVQQPPAPHQGIQFGVGGDLFGRDVDVHRADQHRDGLVRRAQARAAVESGDLPQQLERKPVCGIGSVAYDAVYMGEAAVDGADVHQAVQHPAGHIGVLVVGALGHLHGGDACDRGNDVLVLRAILEVHLQGHRVDGRQGQLLHLITGPGARGEQRLTALKIEHRVGHGERLHPRGQP